MSALLTRIPVTIANGQSISGAAALNGLVPSILMMSDAWTAASLSIAGSPDGTTFYWLTDTGGTILNLLTAAQNRIPLTSTVWGPHHSIKILSGTPALPVAQAAERILYLEVWS